MIVPKEGKVSKFIEQRLNSVKISFISKVTVDSKKLMEKYSEVFAHFNEQIASEDPERVVDGLASFSVVAGSFGKMLENYSGIEIIISETLKAFTADDLVAHSAATEILRVMFETCPNITQSILSENPSILEFCVSKIPEPKIIEIIKTLYIEIPEAKEYLNSIDFHGLLFSLIPKFYFNKMITKAIMDFLIQTREDVIFDIGKMSVLVDMIVQKNPNGAFLLEYICKCLNEEILQMLIEKQFIHTIIESSKFPGRKYLMPMFSYLISLVIEFESENINGLEVVCSEEIADFIGRLICKNDQIDIGLRMAIELTGKEVHLISEDFFDSFNIFTSEESNVKHEQLDLFHELMMRMLALGDEEIMNGLEEFEPLKCIEESLHETTPTLLLIALQITALLIDSRESVPTYIKEWIDCIVDDGDFIESIEELSSNDNSEIAEAAHVLATALSAE